MTATDAKLSEPPQDYVLRNVRAATMIPGESYGLIERAAIAVSGGRLRWLGPQSALPSRWSALPGQDMQGRLATPALVDCHTHLVYGGSRAREWEQRLQGASYEQIARAGGGILSTVNATRRASAEALLRDALARVDRMIGEGVAGVEIKSGYGLDLDTELKMLQTARAIAARRPLRVQATFLGAHALPPEYQDRADGYIETLCEQVLPALQRRGVVDAVDAFCERIGFTPAQVRKVFERAAELGLPVKLHAEQLSNLHGAALAAGFRALSADHLEYLDPGGVAAMAAAGTVAVLLPGAFYTLGETRLPPVDALREAGVPIAVATDCNPGSSPLQSPLLAMNMACTLFRLTPEEALAGMTREAARALGWNDCGVLQPGRRADIAIWDVEHPAELVYPLGVNPLHRRLFAAAPRAASPGR